VRAVDTTGNTLDGATVRDYLNYPNAGFCTPVSVVPSLVDGTTVQLGSLNTTHLSGLDASIIQTGKLRINTSKTDYIDGILVYNDAGTQIGRWDETGLYIIDPTTPGNYVQMVAGGITVYFNGVATTAITPSGISATGITSGALPGAGNLIYNSSFELADFQTPATYAWTEDTNTQFTATTSGSNVNASYASPDPAGDIHMTAAAY
jgi:hypothetical protein